MAFGWIGVLELPPQVALKVSESYLSDLRSEFLPLTLGFSGA